MVDSGAAFCSLRKDIAQELALKFDPNRTIRIVTASRQPPVFVPITEVSTFRVGGFIMQNLSIMLLDLPDELGVAGLIGMNLLRQFRMCIEPDTAALVLRKLPR